MRLAPPPTLKFTVHTVYWSIIYRYKYWGKNYNISLEVCTEVQYSYLWTFILKRQNAVLLFAFQKLTFRSFRMATIAGKGGNRFRLTITTADHACAGTTMGGGFSCFLKPPMKSKPDTLWVAMCVAHFPGLISHCDWLAGGMTRGRPVRCVSGKHEARERQIVNGPVFSCLPGWQLTNK